MPQKKLKLDKIKRFIRSQVPDPIGKNDLIEWMEEVEGKGGVLPTKSDWVIRDTLRPTEDLYIPYPGDGIYFFDMPRIANFWPRRIIADWQAEIKEYAKFVFSMDNFWAAYGYKRTSDGPAKFQFTTNYFAVPEALKDALWVNTVDGIEHSRVQLKLPKNLVSFTIEFVRTNIDSDVDDSFVRTKKKGFIYAVVTSVVFDDYPQADFNFGGGGGEAV